MTYLRDTTTISELTGQPVDTWSEEWRIETEARTVLKMSKQERDVFFNGRKDENGKTIGRGLSGIRGTKAAEVMTYPFPNLMLSSRSFHVEQRASDIPA